jgi:2-amino-4-hydroxy-6-hydroxymethyldihydropteridine diphosphokinase
MSASPPFRGNRAYIGLGSNLGNSLETLRGAAARLAGLGTILAVSSVYETDPVGLEDQPAFLNAVVLIDTTLEPEALLERLLGIEADFHRERTIRWGPRTLDLDLLWYEGAAMTGERLTLPHPRAAEREFVLRPLADIDPGLPLAGATVAELLAALSSQGVRPTELALR